MAEVSGYTLILGGLAGLTFGFAVALNDVADAQVREAESVSSGLEESGRGNYLFSSACYALSAAAGIGAYAGARQREEEETQTSP